jgi:hypothetical protein
MFFFAVETWHLSRETAKIIAPYMPCEIKSSHHLGGPSARHGVLCRTRIEAVIEENGWHTEY